MAMITITIADVKDSEVINWLNRLRPLQKGICVDHTEPSVLLQQFWDRYGEYLDRINHSVDPYLIAIHIDQFLLGMKSAHESVPTKSELLILFNNSIGSGCKGPKVIHSHILKKPVYCWLFDRKLLRKVEQI